MTRDWDLRGDELAREAIARGDSTGWFDALYAEGVDGRVDMPWDRSDPQPLLAEWADSIGLDGTGRSAVVVGCGLGADAEYLARLGFDTTAFDIAPTAVAEARRRHPGQPGRLPRGRPARPARRVGGWLRPRRGDLHPPGAARPAPDCGRRRRTPPGCARRDAAGHLLPGRRVAAGRPGTALRLSREFMEGLGVDGLTLVSLDELESPGGPRWRGEYRRA